MTRKIIHIDMDAYYASVEQRDHPRLRGRPVVVGGPPESRGVVASCSYEARRFGVRSAMSSRRAAQLCPAAVFVPLRMSVYKSVSQELRKLFHEVTDRVEPLSLDEAYLDVTENKWGEPLASRIAARLRASIRSDLGLTASAGVGPNKFIAKLASDLKKPDALVVIPPDKVAELLEKLPVERLWGVGPATARKLKHHGLMTTADIRACPVAFLEKLVGRYGHFLHALAYGEDSREVNANREPKSRASETTFDRDVRDLAELERTVRELAADVAASLERARRIGHTVTLKLRYHDFQTITRSRTPGGPVESVDTIAALALELLRGTEAGRRPARLVGVTVSHLQVPGEATGPQLALDFGD